MLSRKITSKKLDDINRHKYKNRYSGCFLNNLYFVYWYKLLVLVLEGNLDNGFLFLGGTIMNELQKEENWYSIKELAEGFGVSELTVRNNVKLIFANKNATKIDFNRKMISKGKSRTYYYNESVKNELMKKLASNQLNQGKNSSVGRQAVKEVISQKIEDVTFLKLIQQNEEIIRRNDELIRQNNEILKSLQNTMNYITGKTPISENDRIRKDIQDYIMMYSEKEKISYEQGIKEFVDEFEYRNHINLRIRSKRNGYNSILEYAEKNNLLPELLEVARNMK